MLMNEKEKRVFEEISHLAEKYHAKKVILFGSRARRTHSEKSDIDLAVYGCEDFDKLYDAIQNEVWALLEFDIINMDEPDLSADLLHEIDRDGVVIYEKIR